MQSIRSRKAFTMIELIVVIVIIGILAAIAVVGYQAVVERAEVEAGRQAALSVGKEAAALAAFDAYTATPPSPYDLIEEPNDAGVTVDALDVTPANGLNVTANGHDFTLVIDGTSVTATDGHVAN